MGIKGFWKFLRSEFEGRDIYNDFRMQNRPQTPRLVLVVVVILGIVVVVVIVLGEKS